MRKGRICQRAPHAKKQAASGFLEISLRLKLTLLTLLAAGKVYVVNSKRKKPPCKRNARHLSLI